MVKNVNRQIIFEYLLVFYTVLYSGHALAASSKAQVYIYGIFVLPLIALVFGIKSEKLKVYIGRDEDNIFFQFVGWMLMMLLNYAIHVSTESLPGYAAGICYAFCAFIIVKFILPEHFIRKYLQIMLVLSVFALVFFLFIQNTNLFSLMPTLKGGDQSADNYDKYRGLLIYYSLDPLRNNGPFWEPGIFASHLIVSLLFVRRYIEGKKQIYYYAVFIAALITTYSTAGYMLLVLVLLCIMSYRISKSDSAVNRLLFSIVCVAAIIAVIYLYFNLDGILIKFGLKDDKTFGRMVEIAENSRYKSILWNYERFLEKPLFGFGYGGLSAHNDLGIQASATTSMRLLAAHGFLGIAYTLFIVVGVIKQKAPLITRILFLVIWIIITNKEGQDSFVMNWVLIFYLNSSRYMLFDKGDGENESLTDTNGGK